MRLPKLAFPLVFAVLFAQTLFSQNSLAEGYYIDVKKDTIRGFFDFDELFVNRIVFYKKNARSASQLLAADSIQKIETLNGMVVYPFMHVFRDKIEPIFVTRFIDGDIKLYKGKTAYAEESEVFCINSVKMPEIRKITQSNPKAFLNTYFKGCELGPYTGVRYTENGLIDAIKEISKCAYPSREVTRTKVEKPRRVVAAGVKIGGFYNTPVTTDFFGDRPSTPNIKPTIGAVLSVDVSNSIVVYTGVNYFERLLTVPTYFKESFFVSYTPFEFKTHIIEVPITIHYELNRNKPTYIPKIIAGMSALFPFNSTIQDIGSNTSTYDISNYYQTAQLLNLSFCVGGGVKRVLKNGSIVELDLRYAYDNENLENTTKKSRRIHSRRFELSFNYLMPLSRKK